MSKHPKQVSLFFDAAHSTSSEVTENVKYPAVIPNFFCKKWKTFVMYWWFVYVIFFKTHSLESLLVQVSLY